MEQEKNQIITICGTIEIEVSDQRFVSGRVYELLRIAAKKYPKVLLVDAIKWAKETDESICSGIQTAAKAGEIAITHDFDESLKKLGCK